MKKSTLEYLIEIINEKYDNEIENAESGNKNLLIRELVNERDDIIREITTEQELIKSLIELNNYEIKR